MENEILEEKKPEEKKIKLMNVPNVLSLIRMLLVPICIAAVLYMPAILGEDMRENNRLLYYWLVCSIPTLIFIITSATDLFDGLIARKYGLITDFGKFIDPLADKFMVFGLFIAILASDSMLGPAGLYDRIQHIFIWVTAAVFLRELSITSLRMVIASKGAVIPASWWGKVKTCTQIGGLIVILMEPALLATIFQKVEDLTKDAWEYETFAQWLFIGHHILSWIAMVAILVTTIGSGIDYIRKLWPYISGKK